MKSRSLRALVLASALILPGQSSFGQSAAPELSNIPQPHLAKARAEAFGENGWKFPALITCYPNEGQSAEHVIKDPGPAKAADNLYFLGDGIVAAWAVDTSDGIILIDTLNNREEADKYIIWGPPPHRDQVANDGQTVTLGDVSIKLFITAGHTPASLSMLIPVKDKGVPRTLLYLGGITNKNLSPAMHAAYDQWTSRLLQVAVTAKPDGVIGNHSSYDEAATKIDKLRIMPDKPNPFFTGADNSLRYLRVLKECNLNNAEIERAQGK
jgi:hypothetical protein